MKPFESLVFFFGCAIAAFGGYFIGANTYIHDSRHVKNLQTLVESQKTSIEIRDQAIESRDEALEKFKQTTTYLLSELAKCQGRKE